jgi:hypothetical protein
MYPCSKIPYFFVVKTVLHCHARSQGAGMMGFNEEKLAIRMAIWGQFFSVGGGIPRFLPLAHGRPPVKK